ncbi:MEDS domain-containing protein [Candidatus Bipolaricaulota bacterium]|nr:MEDS domain-containing protein [Candidatus Bipolaricaulota bacterium]
MLYYSVDIQKSIDDKGIAPGQLVRKLREQMGLSQWELAEPLGVHWVTVSRWESGRVEPRTEYLHELAPLFTANAFQQVKALVLKPDRPLATPTPHALLYILPELELALRDYVEASLEAGYYLCFVACPAEEATGLCSRWQLPPQVLTHPHLKFVSLKDAYFRDGRYDLSQMNWLGRKIEEELVNQGYRHIRWIGDLSPLLKHGVSLKELLVMEYNADSVFHSQSVSEGLSIYPFPEQTDDPYQACILCRHPWLLGTGGFAENPYYNNPLLCWARGQLKARRI